MRALLIAVRLCMVGSKRITRTYTSRIPCRRENLLALQSHSFFRCWMMVFGARCQLGLLYELGEMASQFDTNTEQGYMILRVYATYSVLYQQIRRNYSATRYFRKT